MRRSAADALWEAQRGGVLIALVALRYADADMLRALALEPELLTIVARAARVSRHSYAARLRTALHTIETMETMHRKN